MRQRVHRELKQRCFGVPDYDSPAVDGGAAASSSGGAIGAQEAEPNPSPEGASGTSRLPCISRIEGNTVAIVCERQIDVKPR